MLRGMKAKPINPRWLAFVDELMVDESATRAHIAARNRPKAEQNDGCIGIQAHKES